MDTRFTQHVIALDPREFPNIEFWDAFAAAIRSRLRRNGLLKYPPAILGYAGNDPNDWDDVLQDVTYDCYEFAILKRFHSLTQQLKVRDSIDGLVLRNIDNFILEKQRRTDPLGYAVFKNIEAGLRLAIEREMLTGESLRDGKLRNETILRFPSVSSDRPAPADRLRDAVKASAAWEGQIHLLARQNESAQQAVLAGVADLRYGGIDAFMLKDLVDIVKGEVRDCETVGWSQDLNTKEFTELVAIQNGVASRIPPPDGGYEIREHHAAHVAKVRDAILQLDRRAKTKEHLIRVFDEMVAMANSDEDVISQAELGRRLGLRTSTISDYCKLIRSAWTRVAWSARD